MTNDKENHIPDDSSLQDNQQTLQQRTEDTNQVKEQTIEQTDSVDPKDARIAELEITLHEVQQRERDNVLRAKAEVENLRRRSEQDIEKAYKFSLERFVSSLLPVIDNLERALDISENTNSELAPIIEGIALTLKSFIDVIHKFGVSVICETFVPFNPEIHQAMTALDSDEYQPNQVIKIMQKGYTLNGRLIRPALVSVSKTKT